MAGRRSFKTDESFLEKLGNTGAMTMKKEYDFAKAKRGRFYRPGVKLNLPVYLEPQIEARLATAARKRGEDLGTLVNRLLKHEIEMAEVLR